MVLYVIGFYYLLCLFSCLGDGKGRHGGGDEETQNRPWNITASRYVSTNKSMGGMWGFFNKCNLPETFARVVFSVLPIIVEDSVRVLNCYIEIPCTMLPTVFWLGNTRKTFMHILRKVKTDQRSCFKTFRRIPCQRGSELPYDTSPLTSRQQAPSENILISDLNYPQTWPFTAL